MNISLVKTLILLSTLSITLVGCNKEIPNDNTVAVTTIGTTGIQTQLVNTTLDETKIETTIKKDTKVTSEENVTTTDAQIEEIVTTEQSFFGYTLDNVNNIAIDLYNSACDKYRNVLIDGSYGVDLQTHITDQYGKRYYLVDNAYFTSLEDVLNDWHTVFNENYDYLVTYNYIMYEDRLYAYTGIQQKNTNFKSTNLVYYYLTDDYQLTFKATSNYSSGDKVFKFSIVYNPDSDEWRVSEFTMPY